MTYAALRCCPVSAPHCHSLKLLQSPPCLETHKGISVPTRHVQHYGPCTWLRTTTLVAVSEQVGIFVVCMLQGLVLPPRMAPQQVVVIPIPNSKMPEDTRKVSICIITCSRMTSSTAHICHLHVISLCKQLSLLWASPIGAGCMSYVGIDIACISLSTALVLYAHHQYLCSCCLMRITYNEQLSCHTYGMPATALWA